MGGGNITLVATSRGALNESKSGRIPSSGKLTVEKASGETIILSLPYSILFGLLKTGLRERKGEKSEREVWESARGECLNCTIQCWHVKVDYKVN